MMMLMRAMRRMWCGVRWKMASCHDPFRGPLHRQPSLNHARRRHHPDHVYHHHHPTPPNHGQHSPDHHQIMCSMAVSTILVLVLVGVEVRVVVGAVVLTVEGHQSGATVEVMLAGGELVVAASPVPTVATVAVTAAVAVAASAAPRAEAARGGRRAAAAVAASITPKTHQNKIS